jgi:teichuronic acid exporter
LKKTIVLESALWRFLERITSQGINILIQIILARLLAPEQFGQFAIIIAFTNIAAVFVLSGFPTYIIQMRNIDDESISSLFITSIIISIIMSIGIWLFAPLVLEFSGYGDLTIYLNVLSIILIINAINGIQIGILSRKMMFKTMFLRSIVVLPISGIIGVVLSYKGYGLWALIIFSLVNQLFTCILMTFSIRKFYKFRYLFSARKVKEALTFSWKVLLQELLTVGTNSFRYFTIGKQYSSDSLAYYDRAYAYTGYVQEAITYTASSVLLPTMSRVRDNINELTNTLKRSVSLYAFIISPILLGFAAISKSFVIIVLTDKWINTIPFIIIFCVGFLHYPITTLNKSVLLSVGRSDLTLRISILSSIITLIILGISLPFGIMAIAFGTSISMLLSILLYAYPVKKLFNIRIFDQVKNVIPYYISGAIMGVLIWPIQFLNFNTYIILILQIILGTLIYIFLMILTKDKNFKYIYHMILSYLDRKLKNN